MIKGLHHIGATVHDLEAATRRYIRVGDMVVAADYEKSGHNAVLLRGANGFLRLAQSAQVSQPPSERLAMNLPGITHFCIQSSDIETVTRALSATGFALPHAPVDLGTGFRYAYAWSPDGLVIEAEGAPFAHVEPDLWIGHVAFATADLERLARFYAELTAGELSFSPRLSNNAKYDQITGLKDVDVRAAWVRGLNVSLEFWQYLNPATLPRENLRGPDEAGFSHLAFEVEDLALARSHALALGAADSEGPALAVDGDVVWLRDPDGNALALVSFSRDDLSPTIASLPHRQVIAAVARQFLAR